MNKEVAIPLLEAVRDDIAANPNAFDQGHPHNCIVAKMECKAGLRVLATHSSYHPDTYLDALDKIGLTVKEREALYWVGWWPSDLHSRYIENLSINDKVAGAALAVERINIMIATGK